MSDPTLIREPARERNGGGHRGTRHAQTVARQVEAMTLRATGMGYDEIARRCGFASRSGAFAAVQRGLRQSVREAAEEVVALELARLDRLQASLWPVATAEPRAVRIGGAVRDVPPSVTEQCRAVAAIVRLMQRRAALLGLDRAHPVRDADGPSLIDLATALSRGSELDPVSIAAEAEAILKMWRSGTWPPPQA